MTIKKKKQHYVPRFYLKYFSINEEKKLIGIYNTIKEIFIEKGDLKNQAKENYFYDNDGKVEDVLSDLESASSRIFVDILKNNNLPKEKSEDHITLLVFILVQIFRTKFQADLTNDMIDKLIKQIFKHDKRFNDNIKIGLNKASALPMSALKDSIPMTLDLKFKLIKNNSKTPFITSDNPVVKYNQLLEKRKQPGGITGLASRGLQIFLPISPKLTLLLYDYQTYKVGNRKNKIIEINCPNEISQINLLQVLNCDSNLYFNEFINIDYINKLQLKSKKYNKAGIASVNEYISTTPEKSDTTDSLLVTGASDIKIKLKIQGIKETSSVKYFKLDGKSFYPRSS